MERPVVSPLLFYRDPKAALAFLQNAFGFETRMVVEDGEGGVIHSESFFGGELVMVCGPPSGDWVAPGDPGGCRTASVHVQLREGIDAHCERARDAGAQIDREPADQPYGDRVYTCRDPEGHSWSFGQTLVVMSPAEMADATGRNIRESL